MELDFQTNFFISLIICLATISQAIFGVGILLWGTPALMLLNYNFLETLGILLPVSLFVSCLQFAPNNSQIDFSFIAKFMKFSICGLIIGLLIAILIPLNLEVIASFMLFITFLMRSNQASSRLKLLISKHDTLFMLFLGFSHGVSNLGGSLLVARLSLNKYSSDQYRTTVAAAYSIFATSQLIILFSTFGKLTISVNYILLATCFYLFTVRFIVNRIDHKLFNSFISAFILILAIFLVLKSFI
jgi:uncharacterized membrane protein YfcA